MTITNVLNIHYLIFLSDMVSVYINHRMRFYIDFDDFVPYTIGHWRNDCGLSEYELDYWYQ